MKSPDRPEKTVRRRMIRQGLVLGICCLLLGCSSQESRENLSTLLCWLRPSCLPSHSTSSRSRPARPHRTAPVQTITRQSPPPCHTTAKTTISKNKPSITVSYDEPDTQADGKPLTNLAKTSIYQNKGSGFIKVKDVPATSKKGGETITETLIFEVGSAEEVQMTICVTATNTAGQES